MDKTAIENHMASLIKGYQNLWTGYQEWLLHMVQVLESLKPQAISISKGDSFIKFNSINDDTGINSLFFVYEIGSILPRLTWRHLIRSSRFNYNLLKKPISCIPAFSFSLDRQITLLYWGEHIPYLLTPWLRNLELINFVLKTNKPSSVEVSAANLAWPKSAYQLVNQELEHLAAAYLFNSFMPPILDGIDKVWFESPFVLIKDREVEFLTIHKTLCTIDEKTARTKEGVVNANAKVIDRNFAVKRIPIDIPKEHFEECVTRESLYEVIFVKTMKFRSKDLTIDGHTYYIRYKVYPFETIKLFGGESYGPLLSVVSMVLRECYLRSSDLLSFTISPEDFKLYLRNTIGQLCHEYMNKQVALRLVESRDGLYTLASLLKVYVPNGSSLSYCHPALIECFTSILENQFGEDDLIRFQRVVLRYGQKAKSTYSLSDALSFQELFKEEFGSNLDYNRARLLIRSLYNILNICIPFSKALCLRR